MFGLTGIGQGPISSLEQSTIPAQVGYIQNSKLVSYSVLAHGGMANSKQVGYNLLTPHHATVSKLVAYAVLTQLPGGGPQLIMGM